jgi:hypothetical protein
MPALTFANTVPETAAPLAEFRLLRGGLQIARIGVHAGGKASVPLSSTYAAQATTTMGDFTLTSNTVTFTSDAVDLVAQVLDDGGYDDFQIVQRPASQLSAILLQNTWRAPVEFTLTQPGTPVLIISVVDENNNATVSTAQQWTCYAIVNGITTASVTTEDPNATFTVLANGGSDDYQVVVS